MRILFVHQNFPGQFLHLAPALRARGHDVRALTHAGNKRPFIVPTYQYAFEEPKPLDASAGPAGVIAPAHWRGVATAQACDQIRRKGFTPDVIAGNPGWGEMTFLKEVWPQARVVTYCELFYNTHGFDTDFDPELQTQNLGRNIRIVARQAPMLHALAIADRILSPTRFQASSLPPAYRDRVHVVHDGVDTDVCAPSPTASVTVESTGRTFAAGDEVITFINRNLEPYRGYHVFMRALPRVLAERPNAHVVLVGGDGVAYGTPAPEGKSWKQIYLDEVKDRLDLSRVHFAGRVPYKTFLDLMRVSRAHAYLTYPFVLSWSMLEAMACGALVVGSRTAPVAEIISHGENGLLVDFFDIEGWSRTLIDALAAPEKYAGLRQAARRTVVESYDLKTRCLPELIRLVETT